MRWSVRPEAGPFIERGASVVDLEAVLDRQSRRGRDLGRKRGEKMRQNWTVQGTCLGLKMRDVEIGHGGTHFT